MKICDLTQFYSPVSGGVRRYIEQKSAYVRNHRPDCEHIIVVPGAETARKEEPLVRTYTIESPLVSRTSRYRALTKLHLVEEVLERERPDIIESGDPYQLAWKAVASGRGLDIPVVGFYHSHFPEAHIRTVAKYFGRISVAIADELCRRYVNALYNHFERTFVPSPVLARMLSSWGVENLMTVDLGVDASTFRPDPDDRLETRATLGVDPAARFLLYVGRLAPEKNIRTLLGAFRLLDEHAPGQYHLLCVGDGSLRQAVLALGRAAPVSWMPYCTQPSELASIYRAADVFVHPGVQETFGLVALESQASGTCVVGIHGSYMDRIIFNDQGHWARENSPTALAEAIEAMFGTDLRAAGLEASRHARERYAWESVFERLFGSYAEVVGDYRP